MIVYRNAFNINKAILATSRRWPLNLSPQDAVKQAMIVAWRILIDRIIGDSEYHQPWQMDMPASAQIILWAEPDGLNVVCCMAVVPYGESIPAHIEAQAAMPLLTGGS